MENSNTQLDSERPGDVQIYSPLNRSWIKEADRKGSEEVEINPPLNW